MISIEDFKKIEMKLGMILLAEKIPDTEKLLKLTVDVGEEKPRQIVSGISLYFPDPKILIGKKCMFVANLEPKIIRGIESQGMILALSSENISSDDANSQFSLLIPEIDIPTGAKIS
jgi:methionine--tRNA ligase beta chain